MRSWINNGVVLLFAVLSVLARLSSFYAGGVWSWISILTLALWGILGINLLLLIVLLFTEKKWKAIIPMVAIGLHADYLNAVYQVSSEIPNDNNGMPLTLISYNASHFYWEKQYTLKDAASYIGKYRPDILCLQEAPNENNYHQDSIRQEFGYLKYSCTSFRTDHSPLAIYSRYPIVSIHEAYYIDSWNMSLIADIRIDDQYVRVINNHLETTSVNAYRGIITAPDKSWRIRMKAVKDLVWKMADNNRKRALQANYIRRQIEQSPYPVIVCGDFNDTPASYTYHRIKGNLTDGFQECGNGYQYTFRQLCKLWRIDYILHSTEFEGTTNISPDLPYSDHNPVVWEGRFRL